MPISIDSELRRRCAASSDLALLLAQWEYDQRLLEQALGTVGHLFPHYSQHDGSHSRTILERIAALLGPDNLARLSGTDLWLLLESAYFHDAGMVASYARKLQDVASPEFTQHVERCASGEASELMHAARRLRDDQPRKTPAEILHGNFDLLLVYSEFVRARHPQRAAEFALDPLKHLAIPTPRTHLLPARFWHILGEICRSHGEDRTYVMGLPHEESGVAGELCHPRFVACMLRLGDLLDLDSGRFCPSINAMVPRLPDSSEAHRLKHEGVRHLVVSPRRVSVIAVYTDVEAYLEAERWFSWLKVELRDQLLSWDQIAPSATFGSLPSLGDVEARLEGQVVFAAGSRPCFEVDSEKMLELVRGANLYRGPEDAVREVIQNAIDASLLRLAFDSQCAGQVAPESLAAFKSELGRLPIAVSIEKAPTQPSTGDTVRWVVQIRDQGIGLRLEDVAYLLRLGSSSRNHGRRELAAWLPEWARPSGTFGIGFHSLFEYCQKVTLTSRHPTDPEGVEVTIRARPEGDRPAVLVKRWARVPYPPPPGTCLEAEFDFPLVPQTVTWGSSAGRQAEHVLREYDLVNDGDLPYHAAKMRDTVADLARSSLCTIQMNGGSTHMGALPEPRVARFTFEPAAGVELRLRGVNLGMCRVDTSFRGADVDNGLLWPLLALECNLHAGNARDLLELSRSKFTRKGNAFARQKIDEGLTALLGGWLAELRTGAGDQEDRPFLSLYAHLFGHPEIAGSEWREIFLDRETKILTLGQLADASTIALHFAESSHRAPPATLRTELGNGDVTLIDVDSNNVDRGWLPEFLLAHFPSRSFLGESAQTRGRHYTFSKSSNVEDVSDEGLRYELVKVRSAIVGRRGVLLCPAQFAALALPDGTRGWWNIESSFVHRVMADPFVGTKDEVTIPGPEAYVRWLAKLRGHSEKVVASTLAGFLKHADLLVADGWAGRKRYNLEAVIAGLHGTFGVGSGAP